MASDTILNFYMMHRARRNYSIHVLLLEHYHSEFCEFHTGF